MERIMIPLASSIYVGRHAIRHGGGRLYLHLPIKSLGGLVSKRVKVVAQINTENCVDKTLNGSLIMFITNLVGVGGTYRVNIPSYYVPMMSKIADCGELDVWVIPI
jgi:hypothetical protein